ncbi:hypothetical protein QTP86_013135 [Hemibagrus guttatus]|nr:hypothetical protein QTP86_013135 [Hemibagrus guttatus]
MFVVIWYKILFQNTTKAVFEHWSLRLSGGKGSCSGRLEVYHNSTWGSVCDDQWNIRNAQVVCRQLGCGSALSADRKVSSGSGEGTIWLNRVKCRGDEIHLWDCHRSLKKHTDCSHAGVTCAVVSRTRRKTEPEAVYEEINHRYMARRITSFTQRVLWGFPGQVKKRGPGILVDG